MRYIVLSHIRYIASPVVKNYLTDVGTWQLAIPHGGPLGDPVLLHGRADASEQDQHTAEQFDHDRHERPSGCRMGQVGQLASCQHSAEDEDSRHRGRHRWHPADAGYHQAGQDERECHEHQGDDFRLTFMRLLDPEGPDRDSHEADENQLLQAGQWCAFGWLVHFSFFLTRLLPCAWRSSEVPACGIPSLFGKVEVRLYIVGEMIYYIDSLYD